MSRYRNSYRFNAAYLYERKRRKRRQRLLLHASLSFIFLGIFALGFNRVVAYEAQIQRQSFTIAGKLPVTVLKLQPIGGDTSLVAIVAHGFSGSKELMTSYGVELARAGITTYLFDFPGHGESPTTLPTNDYTQNGAVNQQTLDEVVNYSRSHNNATTHPRIVLLGHSMGSAAVGDYVMAHPGTPDLLATILVSPVGQEYPTTTWPRNLLLLVGQNDLPETIPDSRRMLQEGCNLPQTLAQNSDTFECGNPTNGTARRLVILPNLNHITILNASNAFQETLQWLQHIDPNTVSTGQLQSNTRLFWLGFGVVGILLAIFSLGTLLLEFFQVNSDPHSVKGRHLLIFYPALLIGIGATLVILHFWQPFSFLHALLTDYLGGYFFFVAVCMSLLIFAIRRFLPLPSSRQLVGQVFVGLLLAVILYFTLGNLLTFAWERFLLTPARLWRLGVLFLLLLPIFLLDEGINRGYRERGPVRALFFSLFF
ncbi:MAG TPA: alpha/beta fold hydrolase, partial [Ktedonobacteraceae bacterium]|nr:alpha/beta fold hydrolase [Ktedonobacteraceae bacterium]